MREFLWSITEDKEGEILNDCDSPTYLSRV